MFKLVICLFLIFSFWFSNAQAQQTFKTESEYLDYVNKNFGIPPDEIYYIPLSEASKDGSPLEHLSMLMFFKGKEYATIESITENAMCPPKKLIKTIYSL